jgi:polyphosphate kinase 2 (PPK2 family)
MIERTSTPRARWTLVPGNDKNHARIQVLETVVLALEEALAAH